MLFVIDILSAHFRDFCGVLCRTIRLEHGKVGFCLFKGSYNLFPFGGIWPGFEIFLVKVNGTDLISKFITIEKADLVVGLYHGRIHSKGFFILLNRRGVIQIRHILVRLAEVGVAFVLGIGSRRGLLAGSEGKSGEEGGQNGSVHLHRMIMERGFRKPRLWPYWNSRDIQESSRIRRISVSRSTKVHSGFDLNSCSKRSKAADSDGANSNQVRKSKG